MKDFAWFLEVPDPAAARQGTDNQCFCGVRSMPKPLGIPCENLSKR